MLIRCGKCQTKLKLPDTVAGKKIKCPSCQTVMQIPAASRSSPKPAPKRAAGTSAPARPKPAAKKATGKPPVRPASPNSSGQSTGKKPASQNRSSRSSGKRTQSRGSSQRSRRRSNSAERTRQRSSSRPARRRPPKDEFYDDDDFYDSDIDDFDLDDEDNPYRSRPTASRKKKRRTKYSKTENGLRWTGVGLQITGWSLALYTAVALLMFVMVILGVIVGPSQLSGFGTGARQVGGLLGVIWIVTMLITVIGIPLGMVVCLACPSRTGAKGYIIAVNIIFAMFIAVAFLLSIFARAEMGLAGLLVVLPVAVGALAGPFCYLFFLKSLADFLDRDDLASHATIVILTHAASIVFGLFYVGILFATGPTAFMAMILGILQVVGPLISVCLFALLLSVILRLAFEIRDVTR